jgi:SLT domain-containing protein
MSDESPIDPTNRQLFDQMHVLSRSAMECQLAAHRMILNDTDGIAAGIHVIIGRLQRIEQRLSAIESHITTTGANNP